MKENWWEGQSRFGIRPGLERISALMERLGHPERQVPLIHVAGTNGKGSVSAMVTQALMSQGWRVGLTVSPDLGQINERVMIDRVPLDETLWDQWGAEVEEAGRDMEDVPTFFEAVTALAFLAFARSQVDIAVIEVGLGGRLDATNIIPAPILSIITPIALDHTDRLGPTVTAIAGEKAGILKAGSELVLARQTFPEAREVILTKAAALGVPVYEPAGRASMTPAGPELSTVDGPVFVPLRGAYQTGNLETAWTAIKRLESGGWIPRVDEAIRSLRRVEWPGRFQVVSDDPLIVVDGAHNPHGIDGVAETLALAPWNQRRWHLLFGVLADKPGASMLQRLLPLVEDVVLTRIPGERGSDPVRLQSDVPDVKKPVVADSLTDAVRLARARVNGPDEALLVVGSLSLLMHLNQQGLFQYAPRLGVDM